MTAPSDYAIGLTSSVTNLASLTTPVNPPKSSPLFYAATVTLGDNSERGIGLPQTAWHWTALPQEMRDQLRQYCPGASAPVYITTRGLDTSSVFHTYLTQMIWPSQNEIYDARQRTDFTIVFRQMVLQPDPAPTLTTVVPNTGGTGGGTTVVLTGTYLSTATAVTFGGTNATSFVVISNTTILAVAPAHAAGAVDVVVTASGGTATKTNGFTYS